MICSQHACTLISYYVECAWSNKCRMKYNTKKHIYTFYFWNNFFLTFKISVALPSWGCCSCLKRIVLTFADEAVRLGLGNRGNINWAWELLKLGPPNLLFGLLKKLFGLLTEIYFILLKRECLLNYYQHETVFQVLQKFSTCWVCWVVWGLPRKKSLNKQLS